jgi:alpha-tubulin suppressor-like RCC1 family protein
LGSSRSTTNSYTPVAVSMPAGVSFSAVSTGVNHSLALDGSGHAWAWGLNDWGQLGDAAAPCTATRRWR